MNLKLDKCKENYTGAHHSQIIKNQKSNKIFKVSKEKNITFKEQQLNQQKQWMEKVNEMEFQIVFKK